MSDRQYLYEINIFIIIIEGDVSTFSEFDDIFSESVFDHTPESWMLGEFSERSIDCCHCLPCNGDILGTEEFIEPSEIIECLTRVI
jgi:hypothetical protein